MSFLADPSPNLAVPTVAEAPSFWKTVWLLLGSAHRRSVGRRRRQQELLSQRSGNTTSTTWHLPDFVPPSGRIYLLTGPQTFSAAITTTAFVKQAAGSRAIILGEPVGDRLTFYGEGNEDLCLHYATGMHDYAHRCDDWDRCYWLNWILPVQVKSLAPDETIKMSFADYMARRDPVFERAVALAVD